MHDAHWPNNADAPWLQAIGMTEVQASGHFTWVENGSKAMRPFVNGLKFIDVQ